jgi:hypothetical protein
MTPYIVNTFVYDDTLYCQYICIRWHFILSVQLLQFSLLHTKVCISSHAPSRKHQITARFTGHKGIVGIQYGTCSMLHLWRLEWEGGSQIFENFVKTWSVYSSSGSMSSSIQCYVSISTLSIIINNLTAKLCILYVIVKVESYFTACLVIQYTNSTSWLSMQSEIFVG